jgi:hypothetical protein
MQLLRILTLPILLALFAPATHAQTAPATPNTTTNNAFQNPSNPHYWKNKKPYEGYWQQDVHYTINAILNEQDELINGQEILVYTNNSPNTLTEAYFHLYQNAVQPGSLTDELYKKNRTKVKYGKYEAQKLGTVIHSIQINPGRTPIRDHQHHLRNPKYPSQNQTPQTPETWRFHRVSHRFYHLLRSR